ncbi:hypothetical protein [uncultured Desulfovibrio sp.]|uniref:hypothetical protein n=1 Tax=uncultured Desulfovibrio sp. TaxID=167968 RepID=UPI00265D2402|nr:hypothetical protein [uncultured Desulfovibrio sp.]
MSSRAGELWFDAAEDDGCGRIGAAVEVDIADRKGLSLAAAEFSGFFTGLLAR